MHVYYITLPSVLFYFGKCNMTDTIKKINRSTILPVNGGAPGIQVSIYQPSIMYAFMAFKIEQV